MTGFYSLVFKRPTGLEHFDTRIVIEPVRLENVPPDDVRDRQRKAPTVVTVPAELAFHPNVYPHEIFVLLVEVKFCYEFYFKQFAQPVPYLFF